MNYSLFCMHKHLPNWIMFSQEYFPHNFSSVLWWMKPGALCYFVVSAHFLQLNGLITEENKTKIITDCPKLKQGKSKECVCTWTLTIWIFSIKPVVSRSGPWQQVIITAIGHTIVTNANYLIVLVHYTGPHLQRGRDVPLFSLAVQF